MMNIDLERLKLGSRVLHRGEDGTVELGYLDGAPVAIKRFAIRNSQSIGRFEKEAKMLEIPSLQNAVKPIGIVRQAPHYWIVLPYFEHGDLAKFGQENSFSLTLALCLCIDASTAVESVHNAGLVFRDLKSANLLVDGNLGARLCDFGSVQVLSKGIETRENTMGPSGGFHKRKELKVLSLRTNTLSTQVSWKVQPSFTQLQK